MNRLSNLVQRVLSKYFGKNETQKIPIFNSHSDMLMFLISAACNRGGEVRIRPGDFLNPEFGYEAHIESKRGKYSGYGPTSGMALKQAMEGFFNSEE